MRANKNFNEMETHHDTPEWKKRLVDIGALFVAYGQASVLAQPGDRALDVAAQKTEAASVFGSR
ncbi:MAG: hypothetical protein AMXMBFR4_32790 [Candidatus Hydrogenedentota bacterium]